MVGLLIGNEVYQDMRDEIVDAVINKCNDLNLKSTSEHLLVNKQSTIFISPTEGARYLLSHRFAEAMDLAEIGLIYREFLDKTYP